MRRLFVVCPQKLLAPLAMGIAALCFASTGADAQRSAPMARQDISIAGHPNALCNDGTLPIIYFQAGTEDRNKWVIYLQGGGGCPTDAECEARAKSTHDLTSSDDPNLPSVLVGDGLLSTLPAVNPDFAGYTHVFVHYCSSDTYAGDGDRMIGPVKWRFRGAEIVAALVDQLSSATDPLQPSLRDATEVLVTGSSAGAMGVHNNLDRIAARLPQAKVRGIADSGWITFGEKPFAPGMFVVRPDEAAALPYFNAKPDESCVAANPGHPGDCLDEDFAFKYVTTPMFIYGDLSDPQLMEVLGLMHAPQTVAEKQFGSDYAGQLRDSIAAAAVPAYFLANTGRHTVLLNRNYATVAAGGQKLGDVLHAWYFGTSGSVRATAPLPTATGAVAQ